MKKLLLTWVAALCLLPVIAQQGPLVTGTVVDSLNGSAISYATIALLRDSTIVSAAAATADGSFSVKAPAAGPYTLNVSAVGYASRKIAAEIPSEGRLLGKIGLSQGVEMESVVIAVQKPLVVSDAEKLTYSVEDDPQASSSTLEEIIRKVPQLSLDADGNVLLNGQSNYKILLNGRNSASLSNNFKEVIRSMPASQISRIEVITNPSMKYEAEGVGGIINIITSRKNDMYGYNGDLNTGIAVLENFSTNENGGISVQAGKFAASVRAYYNHWENYRVPNEDSSWLENFESQNRYTRTKGRSRYSGHAIGANLDLSYQPDTLNLFTLNGWFWTGHNTYRETNHTARLDPDRNPLTEYDNTGKDFEKWQGGDLTLNYERSFGRTGHTLTVSDEVVIDPENGQNDDRYTGDLLYRVRQKSVDRTIGNTVQIDYANPISEHHQIEAGLKHIFRHSESSADLSQTDDEQTTSRLTEMDYRQHILGIYAGYGITYTKWSARAGARMERTWNNARIEETDKAVNAFRNTLFNIVPYASVTYTPATSHSLSLSYTQRLQRPSIYMLSPAVDDTDPLYVSTGNPNLKSAVFHTLNLQYSHHAAKWSITLGVNTFLSNNNMSRYTYTDAAGIRHSTYSDDVHSNSVGFSNSLSYRPSDKLNISFSMNGRYSTYDYDAMKIHTDYFSFSQNLNIDLALWKEARLMLGEYHSTGYISAPDNHSQGYFHYYTGIKQQFLKKRLDVSVVVASPFSKYETYKRVYDNPTYAGWSRSRYAQRNLRFSISWRFGKQNIEVKRAARSIENDDMSGGQRGGGQQ